MTDLIIKYLVDRKVSSQYKNLITATLKHACEINSLIHGGLRLGFGLYDSDIDSPISCCIL